MCGAVGNMTRLDGWDRLTGLNNKMTNGPEKVRVKQMELPLQSLLFHLTLMQCKAVALSSWQSPDSWFYLLSSNLFQISL